MCTSHLVLSPTHSPPSLLLTLTVYPFPRATSYVYQKKISHVERTLSARLALAPEKFANGCFLFHSFSPSFFIRLRLSTSSPTTTTTTISHTDAWSDDTHYTNRTHTHYWLTKRTTKIGPRVVMAWSSFIRHCSLCSSSSFMCVCLTRWSLLPTHAHYTHSIVIWSVQQQRSIFQHHCRQARAACH